MCCEQQRRAAKGFVRARDLGEWEQQAYISTSGPSEVAGVESSNKGMAIWKPWMQAELTHLSWARWERLFLIQICGRCLT